MMVLRAIFRSLRVGIYDWMHGIFGTVCPLHEVWYRSDMCPQCLRKRIADEETFDRRPAWTKAGGAWPVRNNASDTRTPEEESEVMEETIT